MLLFLVTAEEVGSYEGDNDDDDGDGDNSNKIDLLKHFH